ncbi:glycerol-3-phosphate dehydrogenase [Marinobacterium rhizophilum]|uniref:Glycerol-3-phosphate dehydrogenase n=1 Tax=Marinobacterium rhizophilum TaxID=420402 RepID=A0ABY5HN39_9GAMM|nr:glycerol-3-phosphate dehydrogenase [Marinobacterium rhizophilum]UTW13843.1 glycerol-3-phosphate dehydrogenase [Marinobacterium rhizophilum]
MTSEQTVQDLIVIGGGVNGAGIAMDAAGRGLKVMLCEMNDLASATSSSSSKLIHGGLRYLEHYEFRLVREALAERECLLRNSPHIMWPLRFRLPHRPHLRPAWMIRAGLFLYDNLAKRELLPASNGIRFAPEGPLINDITRGFEYSDGWVDDARLVVLVAMAAREKGADIRTRSRCIRAERDGGLWAVTLRCEHSGREETHRCRALVNAAGPWVSQLFNEAMTIPAPKQIRMVKGSHIVVPRIHDEHQAYILQNEDNRIVFVIPYEDNFSLVGTTDVDYRGNPRDVAISAEETDYLISVVNSHFKQKIAVSDVVWSYSGVRPLMDEETGSAQKASRDYSFETDYRAGKAPLLSVFGGKITTYRKLAEAATNSICEHFPQARGAWTRTAALPGGDFESPHKLLSQLARQYPWLPVALARRFVRTYGTLSHRILEGCTAVTDLGTHFGASLYAREVHYLVEFEWAREAEDVLWRRTKQGLYLQEAECAAVEHYIKELLSQPPLALVSARS